MWNMLALPVRCVGLCLMLSVRSRTVPCARGAPTPCNVFSTYKTSVATSKGGSSIALKVNIACVAGIMELKDGVWQLTIFDLAPLPAHAMRA